MQAFTQEQGMQSLAANVLLRDRDGVLWVGTNSGLFRFDGSKFVAVSTNIDPFDLHVNDLYQDSSGRLWIGTARYLYVWKDNRISKVADVPVGDLQRIAGDGKNGVYVRYQHRLVHVLANGKSRDVPWSRALAPGALTDGPLIWFRGHLWTSCGATLCTRTATGTRVWGPARGVPADQWISMHIAKNGDLWVGGMHHLLHLKAGAGHFRAIPTADPVEAIDLDDQGRVLTVGAGRISRWNGTRWQTFVDGQSFHSAKIRDLCFDSQGDALWLATGGRGMLRWRGYDQFRNWLGAQGLDSAPTWAIARDADGRLWLGNQRFGNLLEPGAQKLSPWPEAMRRPAWTNTTALLAHGRQMWAIFNAGAVVRYDLDTKHAQPVRSHAQWTKFGLFDAQGRLWFGTHGVLWRIDHAGAAKPEAHPVDTELAPDTNYLAGVRDGRGYLWFATSHGLLRFAHGHFVQIRLNGKLPAGGLVGIAFGGDGRLWLAPVAGGLFWTRPGHGDAMTVHAVDDALLRHTALYSLSGDADGQVWAASDAGMDVLDGHHWRRLDRSDGLVWDDQSSNALFADTDGSIWLGTSGGVSHVLHPARLHDAKVSAPVILQARYGRAGLLPESDRTMKWNGKALVVTLASVGVFRPGVGYFEYRLLGDSGDSAWGKSTSHVLRYAALAPGSYRLQVRFVAPDLRAHSRAIRLDLVITPPWWRSRWAIVAYALLGLLLLLALWRLHNMHLLRRQARLEHLVDERTRELETEKHALEETRRALEYEASHDALTGLLTRGAVIRILRDALHARPDQREPLAVALIDLDHFKQVNDNHGHLTGDAVLVQCAQLLRRMVPEKTSLGRFGGEELLLLWPGLTRADDVAARLAPLNRAEYVDGATRLRVSCSIGVSWLRVGDDVEAVLYRADAAMYRAKALGRARVEIDE